MMTKKICMIYNSAPKYREAIFRAIDKEYDCDWFFGRMKSDIKEMDLSLLKHTQYYKSFGNPSKLYWQGAVIPCLFKKKYQNYFILSEIRSISLWLFVILKSILFPKKKIYGWSHGWYGRESRLQMIFDKWRINQLDGLFVYNQRARQLMIDGGINQKKLFVIGNSLDYDHQLKIRNELKESNIFTSHFNNNNPVIIFIGRLTNVKRIDILLEAVYILKQKGKNYNVVLIGDGALRSFLNELSIKYAIPVWFYGESYDEKVNAEFIYNSDICVSPGNVGLTAIHSLMFGTPVITNDDLKTQMPESEAIKEDITGGFFKKNDALSLSEAILKWFNAGHKRDDVRKMCYAEIEHQWTPYYQMKVIKENLRVND